MDNLKTERHSLIEAKDKLLKNMANEKRQLQMINKRLTFISNDKEYETVEDVFD